MIEHNCGKRPEDKMEDREWYSKYNHLYHYGVAFYCIYFDETTHKWIATNDEYSCIINYCPWCGLKLESNI